MPVSALGNECMAIIVIESMSCISEVCAGMLRLGAESFDDEWMIVEKSWDISSYQQHFDTCLVLLPFPISISDAFMKLRPVMQAAERFSS